MPFEDKDGLRPSRYYQDIAVERTVEAIAENRPRILFLADRNTLANQVYCCCVAALQSVTSQYGIQLTSPPQIVS